jgi:hypothetical protein
MAISGLGLSHPEVRLCHRQRSNVVIAAKAKPVPSTGHRETFLVFKRRLMPAHLVANHAPTGSLAVRPYLWNGYVIGVVGIGNGYVLAVVGTGPRGISSSA